MCAAGFATCTIGSSVERFAKVAVKSSNVCGNERTSAVPTYFFKSHKVGPSLIPERIEPCSLFNDFEGRSGARSGRDLIVIPSLDVFHDVIGDVWNACVNALRTETLIGMR